MSFVSYFEMTSLCVIVINIFLCCYKLIYPRLCVLFMCVFLTLYYVCLTSYVCVFNIVLCVFNIVKVYYNVYEHKINIIVGKIYFLRLESISNVSYLFNTNFFSVVDIQKKLFLIKDKNAK